MIRFDVVTLFPEMFAAVTGSGITGRALQAGLWRLATWNPRDFTTDSYRTVDGRPYGGGAFHVALWVPVEQGEARVAAALAAGARLVRDEFAPSWWTLADAAGNEVDIATIQGRD